MFSSWFRSGTLCRVVFNNVWINGVLIKISIYVSWQQVHMAITQTTPAHFFLMNTCTQRDYDRLHLPSQNTCWKFILTECNKGSDYLLTAKSPRNFFEYTVTWNLAGKLLEQRNHWETGRKRYKNEQWIPETEIFAYFHNPKFSDAYCEPEIPGYVHFAHEFRASDEQWPLPVWDLCVSVLYFFAKEKFFQSF